MYIKTNKQTSVDHPTKAEKSNNLRTHQSLCFFLVCSLPCQLIHKLMRDLCLQSPDTDMLHHWWFSSSELHRKLSVLLKTKCLYMSYSCFATDGV